MIIYLIYKNTENITGDKNISSTLRIIKILVKYAVELKDELQRGLLETPTEPWKDIIPQLFCRLNHPEAYVRQSISDLLCRIAKDLPHLIVYPAVVGSQDGPTRIENMHKKADTDLFESKSTNEEELAQTDENHLELEEENSGEDIGNGNQQDGNVNRGGDSETEDEEELVSEERKVELQNSYKYLLDTLIGTDARMIEEVKLFVHELRRITLLREELWIGTLNQIRKCTGFNSSRSTKWCTSLG